MNQSDTSRLVVSLLMMGMVGIWAWKKTENGGKTFLALFVAFFSPLIAAIVVAFFKGKEAETAAESQQKRSLPEKAEKEVIDIEAVPKVSEKKQEEESKAVPAVKRIEFCRYCGAQLRENAMFCHKCGNRITEGDSK